MAPEVLYRVLYGRSDLSQSHDLAARAKLLTIQDAILVDHCRRRVKEVDYPGMIQQTHKCVRGTLVTGLVDGDIGRLDAFEGSQYVRRFVYPTLLQNEVPTTNVKAETYIFKYEEWLEREEWDYDDFRKNKLQDWADESEEYDGQLNKRCCGFMRTALSSAPTLQYRIPANLEFEDVDAAHDVQDDSEKTPNVSEEHPAAEENEAIEKALESAV